MRRLFRKIFMFSIIPYILEADDTELRSIMDAISQRYQHMYPDWDVIYLALPNRDSKERERLLNKALSSILEK